MREHLPHFIDFEASSLGDSSYPIEIAWSMSDGQIESRLISPAMIESWKDWDVASEKIHGLTRQELIRSGCSPSDICADICSSITSDVLYSDGAPYDERWLYQLFSVAGVTSRQYRVLSVVRLPYISTLDRETRERLSNKARKIVGGQHRARVDVEFMITYYKLARRECGYG